jgi:hypothetical protein
MRIHGNFGHATYPWIAAAILFGTSGISAAQDTAVILGAGQIGSWSTVGFVANASSNTVQVTIRPFAGPCPLVCVPPGADLPAHASVSLENLLATNETASTFATFYLTAKPPTGSPSDATVPVPDIGARLVDQTHPGRSVYVPVILLSRLEAASPTALNFGGVYHGGFGHSNLVLGNIVRAAGTNFDDLPVTINLFDAGGTLLGSASLTIPYNATTLIGDVANYVSTVPVALGQLRVTKTGGGALMWGILYTVDANGAVTATPGLPLSP